MTGTEPGWNWDTRLRFTTEHADRAAEMWGFNCGPATLCAILDMTPEAVRPLMGDFETKGYTNPTLMGKAIRRAGASYRQVQRSDEPSPRTGIGNWVPSLRRGVMRVQLSGPWTRPGVPMRVRYGYTHWVGMRDHLEIFDVNAMELGGWISFGNWANEIMPRLIREWAPKADGVWWPTHGWEVKAHERRDQSADCGPQRGKADPDGIGISLFR